MTYELAKKLKEAGFPFDFGQLISYDSMPPILGYDNYPALSELIEACGDIFISLGLNYATHLWGTQGWNKDKTIFNIYDSLNPEEAVAKLWLELNKK